MNKLFSPPLQRAVLVEKPFLYFLLQRFVALIELTTTAFSTVILKRTLFLQ